MPEPLSTPASLKPRRTARDRLVRRQRIMERLREGRSYEEIAEAEGLSRERIRQIIVQALEQRTVEAQREHAQLQIMRLAPALRLAAKGIGEGDRRAIADLVRVLDRLDKYQVTGVVYSYDDGAHERLMNKINAAAARMPAHRETAAASEAAEQAQTAAGEAVEAGKPANPLPWGLKP
jgi:DNA-binding CsgD family transcriptional regulator